MWLRPKVASERRFEARPAEKAPKQRMFFFRARVREAEDGWMGFATAPYRGVCGEFQDFHHGHGFVFRQGSSFITGFTS